MKETIGIELSGGCATASNKFKLTNSRPLHKPQPIYATLYSPVFLLLHILTRLVTGVGYDPTF